MRIFSDMARRILEDMVICSQDPRPVNRGESPAVDEIVEEGIVKFVGRRTIQLIDYDKAHQILEGYAVLGDPKNAFRKKRITIDEHGELGATDEC